MNFDDNGNILPKRIKFKIKHDEITEEIIDEYIKNKFNFQVVYDGKANPIFIKKELEQATLSKFIKNKRVKNGDDK